MELVVKNESELREAAKKLLVELGDKKHISLRGEMGAGKTTLTSALCRALGISDDVSSPTFSIINEYGGANGEPLLYHFDFYRIENPEQALDLGLDEYFDSDALCVMEWADNVEEFLPDDLVEVEIKVLPDSSRLITL